MVSSDYELFHYRDELKFMSDGHIQPFNKLPLDILAAIQDLISNETQDVQGFLINGFENNPCSGNAVETFAYCRFGGLDFTADFKVSAAHYEGTIKIQDGEYWDCPVRGSCAAEGVLCKMPVVNGERLLPVDVQIMKLLHTSDTNEMIADRLDLPMGTYHLYKKNLYRKLGNLQTRHEVTRVADSLNIR